MNWFIIFVVSIILVALMIFLVRRNFKDEKKFEKDLNKDFPHARDRPTDIDVVDN